MPNYDVLEDTASYHGTRIVTKVPSKQYLDGWDRIFGNKSAPDANQGSERKDNGTTCNIQEGNSK